MKIILISTNFSEIATNALHYATSLAKYVEAKKLVLYNTYSAPLTTSDMSFSFIETEGLQKMSEEELLKSKRLVDSLLPDSNIEIETRSDYGFTEHQIDGVVHDFNADLVITGIENLNALEEVLDAGGAMQIVRNTQTPVLMVPPDAEWRPVKNIAWACDYKNLNKTTPVWNIKPLLQDTGAKLHVVHNDPNHKQTDEMIIESQQLIKEWFPNTEITFATLEEKDLKEAVNHYVAENQIDMLIAIPKKHNWLESIFSTSHTKQLAFHAHVPVVCLRAVE